MLNYHELTMNQPRDSPEKRKQFLIICSVMAFAFFHAFINAGGFEAVVIEEDGTFPGGLYVYKQTSRDYASHGSLAEHIGERAGLKSKNDYANRIYSLFLDDPRKVSGFKQRFAVGYLATNGGGDDHDKESKQVAKKLMISSQNPTSSSRREPDDAEIKHLGVSDLWPKLHFKSTKLPTVPSAVVRFPFTNGFVSALLLTWKIIPALRSFAVKNSIPTTSTPIVVLTTCNVTEHMCTHYAPLKMGEKFLVGGQPDSETYLASLEPDPIIDWGGVKGMFKMMFPFFFKSKEQDINNNDFNDQRQEL